MNLQVISSPGGEILWVSGPLPGSCHDLTAARIWGIIRELADAGLIVLADKGYIGAGQDVLAPYRGRNKPASQKAANSAHAKRRAPGERANAQLKTWAILLKLHCCPWRAGQIAKGIHVLQAPRDRRMKRSMASGHIHATPTLADVANLRSLFPDTPFPGHSASISGIGTGGCLGCAGRPDRPGRWASLIRRTTAALRAPSPGWHRVSWPANRQPG